MRKHFQVSEIHFFSIFSLDLVFSRYIKFFLVFFSTFDLIVRKDEERMRRLGIFGIFSSIFSFGVLVAEKIRDPCLVICLIICNS